MGVVIDLATVRAAAAELVQRTADAVDSGLRVVLVSDPDAEADEENGWHCYGPFTTAGAAMVADDLRTALDAAGLVDVQVRLVGWEPWPADDDEG